MQYLKLQYSLQYSLGNDRMILICFQDKPFNITVIQACTLITNDEEVEVGWFNEDLQDLELTLKKMNSFSHRG